MMKPGRELDALVAERVMGMTVTRQADAQGNDDGGPHFTGDLDSDDWDRAPPYSTDIAAAWRVVEAIKELEAEQVFAVNYQGGMWWAGFMFYWHDGLTLEEENASISESAPHAICLAALRAMGVEV